jgi:hypothetical protein
LGFAVQLKFFDLEGRFPRTPREIPLSTRAHLDALLEPMESEPPRWGRVMIRPSSSPCLAS